MLEHGRMNGKTIKDDCEGGERGVKGEVEEGDRGHYSANTGPQSAGQSIHQLLY